MKNGLNIEKLNFPQENSDAVCKSCVVNGLHDPNMVRVTAQVDFTDKIRDIVRFVELNSLPAVGEHR